MPASGYQPVEDVLIYNNTIIDVGGAAVIFDWGFGDTDSGGVQDQLPANIAFVNNLIRSSATDLFEGQEGPGYTWSDNIAFGASLGISSRVGLQQVNPQISLGADRLWRPDSGSSPAIDGGTTLGIVTSDMDGQPRIGVYDIGADEVSANVITMMPLDEADGGPIWGTQPPVDPPAGAFATTQAEAFDSVVDPNGDGDTYTVVADSAALGGQAIEAPPGSRTDLPPQDALALYSVAFSKAGTYTAYYRAAGFAGSSNSFFSPSGFGVDPTHNETTSDDGTYGWVTGEEFTVSAADVGLPLQLRIGRREGGNRIDAIALHEADDLSDAQLDALFTGPPFLLGDVNLDGNVDFLDISPFISILSASGFQDEADLDRNGVVDFLDISPFIGLLSSG